ncbi:MAG TPA: hypothetical protein PJ982_02670 [Lacipirellulaceae bacterium]|nr:hypothetical protein [Lacipirellulaceae bacterium]
MAEKIWARLANENDCDAQARLGLLYLEGCHGNGDSRKARILLERAAERGHPKGMIYFAALLVDNSSSGVDGATLEKAYMLATLGARMASYDGEASAANKVLNFLTQHMTQNQMNNATDFAAKWRPIDNACRPRKLL